MNDYSCGAETAMDAYLADSRVVDALHVKANTVGMTYKKTATNLLPLYTTLFERHPNQILIYSGDTDGCVPYVGTEAWTRGLNFTVTNEWFDFHTTTEIISVIILSVVVFFQAPVDVQARPGARRPQGGLCGHIR